MEFSSQPHNPENDQSLIEIEKIIKKSKVGVENQEEEDDDDEEEDEGDIEDG